MSYTEQAAAYRAYALDAGCICPDFPPGIHLEECRLYVNPAHSIILRALERAEREQLPLSRVVEEMLGLEIENLEGLLEAHLEDEAELHAHLEEEHREDQA